MVILRDLQAAALASAVREARLNGEIDDSR